MAKACEKDPPRLMQHDFLFSSLAVVLGSSLPLEKTIFATVESDVSRGIPIVPVSVLNGLNADSRIEAWGVEGLLYSRCTQRGYFVNRAVELFICAALSWDVLVTSEMK